ncbi:AAA family ATPase [Mycolicibacterium thermoresistibile]
MRLHRLTLTNYRGIAHREITFPDRGVVVVSGANEIGKSSMIEALDLLLQAKDRSAKKEVKQVKPTHADVGAEITAEISTGPYRFVYHKRFHKRSETQLTMLAPHREQLSGDEAHERVLAMLGETVDMELWRTQRVLQSGSTAPVDLSGCDALSRALDVAAGEAVETSGAEPLLIDRIDTEYRRYFTATGRPTGEWLAATKRLQAADEEVARCAARVAEVDEAVRRHAALTEDLAELAQQRRSAEVQLTAARTAAETVDRLTRQLNEAQLAVEAAEAAHGASVAVLTERRRLRADIDERTTAIAALEPAVDTAAEDEAIAREVHEGAEKAAEDARAALDVARERAQVARQVVQRLADRAERDTLADRLDRIDAAAAELGRVDAELAAITLTDAALRDIEEAALMVERAVGQAELASAQIELTAAVDVEVHVGAQRVTLAAGGTWSTGAGAPTDIELPGVLTARIVPGAPATQMQAKLEAAQASLAEALHTAGVADVDAARAQVQRRRELSAARNTFAATVAALTGEDAVEQLRARLVELDRTAPVDGDAVDLDGARTELTAAEAAYHQANIDCETHRKAAVVAGRRLAEQSKAATALREKLIAARTELDAATSRLAAQRAEAADEALAVRADTDRETVERAAARVEQLRAELTRAEPEQVAATLDTATRHAETVGAEYGRTADALRELTAQLTVYGTEGRKGELDAAQAERGQAETEFLRVQRLARAVKLLRDTMLRHRDASRRRYVDPFRAEVERLGRLVFGDSFEVEIDSDLCIRSRTLSGRTVDYDSLSGGAKEQLGIVARLAGAALVAKDDTVPVVIDDALGFTDADRLVKMGAVFDAVGGDGQVIVLTCSPDRYAGIGDAHRIELTA